MRIAAALLTLSVLGCTAKASDEQILQLPPFQPSVKIIDRSRPTAEFRKMPMLELRDALEATFRIGPDRRMLQAIPLIDTLNGGTASSEVVLDFRNGGWVIQYKGIEIGRLPYLSGFDEGTTLLRQYAASLPSQRGDQPSAGTLKELEEKITAFSPVALISALRTIDHQGLSLRDPGTSHVALRAFTYLQLQSIDKAGLGDPMFAKTLACLALHGAAKSGEDTEERALVADLMGYERDARRIASQLSETSSIRRFIHDQEVVNEPATDLTLYLQTLHRVRMSRTTDETEDVQQLVASVFPEATRPATRLILEATPFRSEIPALSRRETVDELREMTGSRKSAVARTVEKVKRRLFRKEIRLEDEIEELEDLLAETKSSVRGKLLDATTLRAYVEQNFFSGLWEEGDIYLSDLASDDGTKEFVEALGEQKRSRAAAEVRLWYDTARQLEYMQRDDKWLVERLSHLQKMRPHFRAALLDSLSSNNRGWRFDSRIPAALLLSELDTRPEELNDAAMVFRTFLSDQRRWEIHKTAAFEMEASEKWWFYHQTGQNEKVLAYLEDRTKDLADRGMAVLHTYKADLIDERSARQKFDVLLADPASGGFFRAYGLFLNDVGDPLTKQKALEKWIELHPDAPPLQVGWHKSILSNALERQGRFKEAHEVIAPYLELGSGNVMLQTASTLQRIGKPAEAIELGQQAIARYGDSERDDVAAILWRERRYAEAAELLNSAKYVISSDMRTETIPENFYNSFAKLQPSERYSAFAALAGSNAPVEGILEIYARKKEYETCFELYSILLNVRKESLSSGSGADLSQTVKYIFDASKVLEKLRGSEAARAWSLESVPARDVNEAVVISHSEGADALTFDLSDRPTPKPLVSILMRSFAAARMKLPAGDPRYLRLLRDLGVAPLDNFFAVVSRYLLKLSTSEEMVSRLRAVDKSNPIATYALAVRAMSDGDYEAASDWMVATMLLSRDGDFAIVWAYATVNRWAYAYKSFEQIEREGLV